MSLSAEELNSKLNKTLICEFLVPILLLASIYGITYYVIASGVDFESLDPETLSQYIKKYMVLLVILFSSMFIGKAVYTILAMESAINFFKENNDPLFVKEIETSRTVYIVANVALTIPCLNVIIYLISCYNLSIFFKVKDRLKFVPSSLTSSDHHQPQNSTIGRVILSVITFILLLLAVSVVATLSILPLVEQ